MKDSKIEWCHHTVNWWWGCTKVSEACRFCYAAMLDSMRGPLFDSGRVHWGPNAPRWVKVDSATNEVRRYSRAAKKGIRYRIFCNSMSDTFEDHAQLPSAREIMFDEIVKHPCLDFLLLTKRPENASALVPPRWLDDWPAHVWIGTTVENQDNDKRIKDLLKIPAKVRFLSCEPLLGPVQLRPEWIEGIDWVICGGESGPKARPMHPDWARSLRDQCQEAGVPFFFKQWGEWVGSDHEIANRWHIPHHKMKEAGKVHVWPKSMAKPPGPPYFGMNFSLRVGKKAAGRLLEGREWNEFPDLKAGSLKFRKGGV